MPGTVSAIVVASFEDPEVIRATIGTLLGQTLAPSEIILVDNHPEAIVSTALAGIDSRVRAIATRRNLGYPPACNVGAAEATGDWLFFLNPDAVAAPDCLALLVAAGEEHDAAIVGAQVLLPDGRTNAGDNPVHLTGLSWAGRFEEAREHGPVRPVACASGAALVVRHADFDGLGGYHDGYFLYHDDVDIAWRARLAGRPVLFCPAAVVTHDYEFVKGNHKWFWLERNRLWTVGSNYAASTLLLLTPLLAATELVVLLRAVREGWGPEKLRSWWSVLTGLPELRRWRRRVQALRTRPDADLLAEMTGRFDTPLMASAPARAANPVMDGYRRALLRAL